MTPEQIAAACGVGVADVAQYWPLIVAGLAHFGINDHWTRIAAAGTTATECDFHWLTELASGWEYEGRADLGNTQPGDGPRFRGRGFVQLTGRGGYAHASQVLGIDLVGNPDLAADPHVAGLTLGLYFKEHGIQAMANVQEWVQIRRSVNGGTNGLQRFLACVSALSALPDAPPAPPVTTVAVRGILRTAPADNAPHAINPQHQPVVLEVGTRVVFQKDPHTHQETTPHWACVGLPGTPVWGWFPRMSLQTVGG